MKKKNLRILGFVLLFPITIPVGLTLGFVYLLTQLIGAMEFIFHGQWGNNDSN